MARSELSEGGSLRFKRKDSLELRRRRKWRSLIDLAGNKRDEIRSNVPRPAETRTYVEKKEQDGEKESEVERERSPSISEFPPHGKSTTYGPYKVGCYVQAATSSSG